MCGIAGWINIPSSNLVSLDKMLELIRHRGPDETKTYSEKNFTAGMVRLSVNGLSNGSQPLWSFSGKIALFYNGEIYNFDEIKKNNNLISQGILVHSYPHSWRSKAPLVYKNTSQWFISMDTNDLRTKALKAIDETDFFPKQGQKRLRSMIQDRPDWCVSRQRVWGVPLPIFVNKKTGEPLRDQNIIEKIAKIYELEGGDAWFNSEPSRFLSPEYDPNDFEQVKDVVEVWFDSGSTHSYVLEAREDLHWPASMYLEGSDQHRGWFHSSLLESCGTRDKAPFESILSHGFVVDGKGRKMSKSVGNVISPDEIINKYGADILRIWVVASDYSEDLKIDNQIINYQIDSYRKIRNTLRFLLGNLNNFNKQNLVDPEEMPELERYLLTRISSLNEKLKELVSKHDYHAIYTALLNFCTLELSAFYFDIRKDALYCDPINSDKTLADFRVSLDEFSVF